MQLFLNYFINLPWSCTILFSSRSTFVRYFAVNFENYKTGTCTGSLAVKIIVFALSYLSFTGVIQDRKTGFIRRM